MPARNNVSTVDTESPLRDTPPQNDTASADSDSTIQDAPPRNVTAPDDTDSSVQEMPARNNVSTNDNDPSLRDTPPENDTTSADSDSTIQDPPPRNDASPDDAAQLSGDAPVRHETGTGAELDALNVAKMGKPIRPRAPRDIGARRSRTLNRPVEAADRSFIAKPELICRQPPGTQHWELILSVPPDRGVRSVYHNGSELCDSNGEYRPSSFSGTLVVEYVGGTRDSFPLSDGTPLIFKLPNDWQGDGRKTDAITRGHFLVYAPRGFTRTGFVPVEAEACIDSKFLAHYFLGSLDNNSSSAEGFKEFRVPTAQPGYVLEGETVHDDSEVGELYVGSAPVLVPSPGIVWARVGEEKESGWKGKSFRPADEGLGDVLGGRQGRFFVRVYDDLVRLVDSGEFRYNSGLREIRVNGEQYSPDLLLVPSSLGHLPVSVEFIGDDLSTVEAKLKTGTRCVTMISDGVASIAGHPDGDETTWEIGNTEIAIRLPRLWWRLVVPHEGRGLWRDVAIAMSRNEIKKQSQAHLEVRVPVTIKHVDAGFTLLDQRFPAETSNGNLRRVILPLDAFIEYEEVEKPTAHNVSLKIRYGDAEVALVEIISDKPRPEPPIPSELPDAELEAAPIPDTLRAFVKRPDGGKRPGRGFSLGELEGAGLSLIGALLLPISVDMRRRSVHDSNVEILKEVMRDA